MPSEILTYLESSAGLALQPTPLDYYDEFVLAASTRDKGTMQPPGPGCEWYECTWEMQPDGLHYSLHVQWAPWVKGWLIKNIPKDQVFHRSRLLAVSGNALKVNELRYRLKSVDEYLPWYSKIALKPREKHELFDIVVNTTKKYMHVNLEWIRHYIKDHSESSVGGGYRWRHAIEITSTAEWTELMNILLDNLERMLTHEEYYSHIRWNSGIRARSDDLREVVDNYAPEVMKRSRIILFHPSMSLYTAFIAQKAGWYKEVFDKMLDVLKPVGEYTFPTVVGGQIYKIAADYFREGLPYRANDGKSWESSVGLILGEPFRPFMVYFHGIPMLASGETFTTMLGTMAMVAATRRSPGKWGILGDDANNWSGQPVNLPFVEYQQGDTQAKWILGVRYDIDVESPRISGIKMSMDRAASMIPMDQAPYVQHVRVVERKRDPRTRAAWAGLFFGRFGSGTLLEALARTPPGDDLTIWSPGGYIEHLIEESPGSIDPYAWAEERGIKEVFTVS